MAAMSPLARFSFRDLDDRPRAVGGEQGFRSNIYLHGQRRRSPWRRSVA
jgi:hypothetical protein